MEKIYVVDTNILLHDMQALHTLHNKENKIILPTVVLEELDAKKYSDGILGVNARHAIREIEAGMDTYIEVYEYPAKDLSADNIIIITTSLFPTAILVSNDIAVRVKARGRGILAQPYISGEIKSDDLYSGISTVVVEDKYIDAIYADKELVYTTGEAYPPNHAILFESNIDPKRRAITLVGDNNTFSLIDKEIAPFGLQPANVEQTVLAHHLMNPDIKLVTIVGAAGTGKTLLAIAAALEMVCEQSMYKKVMIARPPEPFHMDMGYLPGDTDDKIDPWLAPIKDNIEFLFTFSAQPEYKQGGRMTGYEELTQAGALEATPLTHLRGRSISDRYIIIDEAQQLNPAQIKTILTRAAKGTKIILTGDYTQIDTYKLSADTNGLVYCVDKMKNEPIAAHVTLTKCKRSELAKRSAELL